MSFAIFFCEWKVLLDGVCNFWMLYPEPDLSDTSKKHITNEFDVEIVFFAALVFYERTDCCQCKVGFPRLNGWKRGLKVGKSF